MPGSPHLVVVHEDAAGRIRHGQQMVPVFSYVRYARGWCVSYIRIGPRPRGTGAKRRAGARCPGPGGCGRRLVVLDGETTAHHPGAVQVLGVDLAPPLAGEGAIPVRPVAPERGEASAPAPPLPVGAVDQTVLLPLQQDRGGLHQPLEVLAGDLRRDTPTHSLPLPLQPRLDPGSVEVA